MNAHEPLMPSCTQIITPYCADQSVMWSDVCSRASYFCPYPFSVYIASLLQRLLRTLQKASLSKAFFVAFASFDADIVILCFCSTCVYLSIVFLFFSIDNYQGPWAKPIEDEEKAKELEADQKEVRYEIPLKHLSNRRLFEKLCVTWNTLARLLLVLPFKRALPRRKVYEESKERKSEAVCLGKAKRRKILTSFVIGICEYTVRMLSCTTLLMFSKEIIRSTSCDLLDV